MIGERAIIKIQTQPKKNFALFLQVIRKISGEQKKKTLTQITFRTTFQNGIDL